MFWVMLEYEIQNTQQNLVVFIISFCNCNQYAYLKLSPNSTKEILYCYKIGCLSTY